MRTRSIDSRPFTLALGLLIVAGLAVPAAGGQTRPAPRGLLEVRVWEAAGRADVDRQGVREATLALLAANHIAIAWRDCGPEDACDDHRPRTGVTLILTPAPRRHCGTTALEPEAASATILVSLPCVAQVAEDLQRSGGHRSDPRLASLRLEHVLAAAIVHELGHATGLTHADRGLMKARLGVDEILALRKGQLTLSPLEATRMRASRLWAEAVVARDR